MGNKLGRRRQVVDERYTRPQGLYVHKDVDQKKLRKLILESKLAPCYPGDDDFSSDHEECPICFLYYPSLNRSRCCMKGICTECFLQMKNPNSTRPTQCPFCKTSNYAVEYRGVKTKEEKGMEQVEEQRVIEAKIRMRHQEIQDEEERMQKRLERSYSSTGTSTAAVEIDRGSSADQSFRSPVQNEEVISSQFSMRHPPLPPPHYRVNRDDDFDLDLEDIMVMEAIWLSIQENGRQKSPVYADVPSSRNYAVQSYQATDPVCGQSSSSPSGGLACAIAALAERQQTGESSVQSNENMSACNMVEGSCSFYNSSSDCGMITEAGTSYGSSDVTEDGGGVCGLLPPPPPPLPPPEEVGDRFQNNSGTIVPESFEEQMMLAMAVSLAEAQVGSSVAGSSSWQ